MKEFKVGERVVLEITETEKETCYGCFFFGNSGCEVWRKYPCSTSLRKDSKNVIFEEVKEE